MRNRNSIVNRRFALGRGFTLPEVLAVMAVIALLIAILLPALTSALRTSEMAKSQNNMKQIGLWMTSYSSENRDYIVPSQFNYSDPSNPGQPAGGYPIKVRSNSILGALRYKGTWCDILWTYNGLGFKQVLDNVAPPQASKYLYDSPDKWVYENIPHFDTNPFRSAAPNTRDFHDGSSAAPKPFGPGAQEYALAGFFAANNFFNADRDAPAVNGVPTPPLGRWYVNGQIKVPQRSMYLVDSFAGETIEPKDDPGPYDTTVDNDGNGFPDLLEVDFRYNGACLMLFLDNHTAPQAPWKNLHELQDDRRIRIQKLDKR